MSWNRRLNRIIMSFTDCLSPALDLSMVYLIYIEVGYNNKLWVCANLSSWPVWELNRMVIIFLLIRLDKWNSWFPKLSGVRIINRSEGWSSFPRNSRSEWGISIKIGVEIGEESTDRSHKGGDKRKVIRVNIFIITIKYLIGGMKPNKCQSHCQAKQKNQLKCS
jgi:hypothetical protein